MDSRILSSLEGARVVVIGDVMLDRFVYGTADRISPEAPIPVMLKSRETTMLGGAANVARNIASLGGAPVLVGAVGRDATGAQIADEMCPRAGIVARLLPCDGHPTTVKTRFVSDQQQILRLDEEKRLAPDVALLGKLAATLDEVLGDAGAVVLSDYNKGLFSKEVVRLVIDRAVAAGVPVIVDPKTDDLSLYDGATLVTPNAKETHQATRIVIDSDEAAARAARAITVSSGIGAALVTRGADGMTLFAPVMGLDEALHMPTAARSVFDVSGAGDTVVATVSLMMAAGQDMAQAAELANRAAGLAVAKPGTATVSVSELAAALADDTVAEVAGRTVVGAEEAAQRAENWRKAGLKVGFANGCFDLVHPGHVKLLEKARAACDRLIVALNTDASVQRLKGPDRPLQDEQSRAAVMAAIRSVDLVTHFDEDTPLELIKTIRPDVLIKGADYTVETVVGSDLVLGWGGNVALIPLEEGHSTTRIVGRAGSVQELGLGQ